MDKRKNIFKILFIRTLLARYATDIAGRKIEQCAVAGPEPGQMPLLCSVSLTEHCCVSRMNQTPATVSFFNGAYYPVTTKSDQLQISPTASPEIYNITQYEQFVFS